MATLHDPCGAALPGLDEAAVTAALAVYPLVTVALTPESEPRLGTRLERLGVRVVPGGPTGEGRRAALAASGAEQAVWFACDFDRWLHWARSWPDELAALPARLARLASNERTRPWYVCLGRTARAFRTHPAAQRVAEAATNHVLTLAAGRRLDAVAGAAWLWPEAVSLILSASREPSAATDLEWAALILRADPARIRGLRCEGLEWETPDFHAAAIAAAGGLEAWTRATFETPAMWTARLRLAAASTAALMRVMSEGVSASPQGVKGVKERNS